MRKSIALTLALLLLVALSACQAQENNKAAALPRLVQNDAAATQNAADKTPADGAAANTDTAPELIERDQAILIALEKAGLEKSDVFDLEAELDRERNGVLWEVDFDTLQYEYSYDINAYDGTVVKTDRERND